MMKKLAATVFVLSLAAFGCGSDDGTPKKDAAPKLDAGPDTQVAPDVPIQPDTPIKDIIPIHANLFRNFITL